MNKTNIKTNKTMIYASRVTSWVKARNCSSSTVDFDFICRLPNKGDWEKNEKRQSINPVQRLVTLHSEIRARDLDDPSPAIFIMKPGED
jgi:hypothetical protein